MSVLVFALVASLIIVACVALEPVEARFRAKRRLAREQQFARDLGTYLAPLMRAQIEQRAQAIAEQRLAAVSKPLRGANGKFAKRAR